MKRFFNRLPTALAVVSLLTANLFAQSGTLDTSFGSGGVATAPCPGTIVDSVMQADGKVVILFRGTQLGNRLIRFNPDGTLDTAFGTGSIATFYWNAAGGGYGIPFSMAIQENAGAQKVIVAGYTKILVKKKVVDALRVDRFLDNGTLDASFGSGGSAIYTNPSAIAVGVQADGKIVTAGDLGQLVRLNTNGSLDTTFGSGGTASGSSLLYPNAVAIQPDGKIVVAGYSTSRNTTRATVARYNANGSVDTTFGSSGRATADFAGGKAWDVAISPDGSILAGGTAGTTTNAQNATAARFTSSGQLDAAFGVGGIATFDSGTGDVGWVVGLQPDGKVLITGNVTGGLSSTVNLLTARFDTAGNVDYPFGTFGGAVTAVLGGASTSRGVFVQNIGTAEAPEYRVLVAGSAAVNGGSAVLARYFY